MESSKSSSLPPGETPQADTGNWVTQACKFNCDAESACDCPAHRLYREILRLRSALDAQADLRSRLAALVEQWHSEVLHFEMENPGPVSPHVAEAYRICADELSAVLAAEQTLTALDANEVVGGSLPNTRIRQVGSPAGERTRNSLPTALDAEGHQREWDRAGIVARLEARLGNSRINSWLDGDPELLREALAEIRRLEQDRDKHLATAIEESLARDAAEAHLSAATQQIAALQGYVQHKDRCRKLNCTCDRNMRGDSIICRKCECTCGLDALQGIAEPTP